MGTMSKPHLQRYVEALNPMQRDLVSEFVDNYEDGLMSRREYATRAAASTDGYGAVDGA